MLTFQKSVLILLSGLIWTLMFILFRSLKFCIDIRMRLNIDISNVNYSDEKNNKSTMNTKRAGVSVWRRGGPYGSGDVTRWPFWPRCSHTSGMWSRESTERRQPVYFFARSYLHTSRANVVTRCCRPAPREAAAATTAQRQRGLAFENAQPVEPVSYLWTECKCTYPDIEPRTRPLAQIGRRPLDTYAVAYRGLSQARVTPKRYFYNVNPHSYW